MQPITTHQTTAKEKADEPLPRTNCSEASTTLRNSAKIIRAFIAAREMPIWHERSLYNLASSNEQMADWIDSQNASMEAREKQS